MFSVDRRSFVLRSLASAFVGFPGCTRAEDQSELGVNFSVVDVDKGKIPFCSLQNGHGAPFEGHAFLPRYPMVRDSVKRTLDVLRNGRAKSIRCVIWFGNKISSSGDSVGLDDGARVGHNLTLFAQDMSEVGISQLMIAFSPQGVLSPGCRQMTWGDCFSPTTMQGTLRFFFDVRGAFSAPRELSVWIDLLNEGMPANNLPAAIRNQFLKLIGYVVPEFRAKFPTDRISISMQGGQVSDRVKYPLENFDADGAGPDFYSVHLYKSAGDPIAALSELLPTIRLRPRPLFVGEIEDDPAYYRRVNAYLQSVVPEQYKGLMVWPLHNPSNQCAIDTDVREIEFGSHF